MDDRRLLSPAVFDMRIQCQPGSVQSAIGKPLDQPGAGTAWLAEDGGRGMPFQLSCLLGPEQLGIMSRLLPGSVVIRGCGQDCLLIVLST